MAAQTPLTIDDGQGDNRDQHRESARFLGRVWRALFVYLGRIYFLDFDEPEGGASFLHDHRPTRRYIPDDDRRRRHNATERRGHSVLCWCYDSDG